MYFDVDTLVKMLRVTHSPKTFALKRAAVMDTIFGVFTVFHTLNAIGERFDERLYPQYHNVDLGEPIYIVAAPRSGTTFLHRLLAADPQFTTLKLYESIFPTVTAHRVAERMRSTNGLLGSALLKLRNAIDQTSFGGWEGLHDTGLNKDEEDEAIWTLALCSPSILLLLPFFHEFPELRFVDQQPEAKKQLLATHYRECLQRHLLLHPGKTLLMKNVLLPGRFEIVTRAAPRARFVNIVRHPYEAIGSMLSLFTMPWTVMAPELHGDSAATRELADLMIKYYRFLHDRSVESRERNDGRFVTMRYTDLLEQPLANLQRIYREFGLPIAPEVERALAKDLREQRGFKSNHDYSLDKFGISKEYLVEQLGDIFDAYDFER